MRIKISYTSYGGKDDSSIENKLINLMGSIGFNLFATGYNIRKEEKDLLFSNIPEQNTKKEEQ